MQATVKNPSYNLKTSHRKEKHFLQELTVISFEDGEFKTPATLRIYGTNAKNYACLWVHSGEVHASGSGSAGGYGYHRPSAAAQEAINAAGFELSEPIDGRGESMMENALKAIATALGHKKFYLHSAHA